MSAEEGFSIASSEDEFTEEERSDPHWHPECSTIVDLYNKIQNGENIELEWQCPGRRSPSVSAPESPFESNDKARVVIPKDEPDEFDFGDDFGGVDKKTVYSPQVGLRNTPGSAKSKTGTPKRVARLDKVMFNIRKYRQLDGMPDSEEKKSD